MAGRVYRSVVNKDIVKSSKPKKVEEEDIYSRDRGDYAQSARNAGAPPPPRTIQVGHGGRLDANIVTDRIKAESLKGSGTTVSTVSPPLSTLFRAAEGERTRRVSSAPGTRNPNIPRLTPSIVKPNPNIPKPITLPMQEKANSLVQPPPPVTPTTPTGLPRSATIPYAVEEAEGRGGTPPASNEGQPIIDYTGDVVQERYLGQQGQGRTLDQAIRKDAEYGRTGYGWGAFGNSAPPIGYRQGLPGNAPNENVILNSKEEAWPIISGYYAERINEHGELGRPFDPDKDVRYFKIGGEPWRYGGQTYQVATGSVPKQDEGSEPATPSGFRTYTTDKTIPSQWKGLVTGNELNDFLNAAVPYMSQADQTTVMQYLYRADPTTWATYQNAQSQIESNVAKESDTQFLTSAERANSLRQTITNMVAAGGATGEVYNAAMQILGLSQQYGGQPGGERATQATAALKAVTAPFTGTDKQAMTAVSLLSNYLLNPSFAISGGETIPGGSNPR